MSETSFSPNPDIKEPIRQDETAFSADHISARRTAWEQHRVLASPAAERVGHIEDLSELRGLIGESGYGRVQDRVVLTGNAEGLENAPLDARYQSVIDLMDADFRKRMNIPSDRVLAPVLLVRSGMYSKIDGVPHIDYSDTFNRSENDHDVLFYVFSVGPTTDTYAGDAQIDPTTVNMLGKPPTEAIVKKIVAQELVEQPTYEGDVHCLDNTTIHQEPIVAAPTERLFMRLEYSLSQAQSDYVPPVYQPDFV